MGVFDGYGTGGSGSSSSTSGGVFSGYRPKGTPEKATPKPSFKFNESKLKSSYQTLDKDRRDKVLRDLKRKAESGDAEAKAKVAILSGAPSGAPVKTYDYTDNSIGGKLFRVREGIKDYAKKEVINPAINSKEVIGSFSPIPALSLYSQIKATQKIKNNSKEQNKQLAYDTAQTGLNIASLLPFGGAVRGVTGVAKAAGMNAGLGGAQGGLDALEAGRTGKDAARDVAVGAGLGAGLTFAGAAVGKGLSRAIEARRPKPAPRVKIGVAGDTATETRFKPQAGAERTEARKYAESLVKERAEMLRFEREAPVETARGLFQAIKQSGGLSATSGTFGNELKEVPSHLKTRRPDATKIDQMLAELQGRGYYFESEDELLEAIADARKVLSGSKGIKKSDYVEEARRALLDGDDEEALLFKQAQEYASGPVPLKATGRGIPKPLTAAQMAEDRLPAGNLAQDVRDMGLGRVGSRENLSSRVQQYDPKLQPAIESIEQSDQYLDDLARRDGDRVISNNEVYELAAERGNLDEAAIMAAKPLDEINTVKLVQAKQTMNQVAQEFTELWQKGEADEETMDEAIERLAKLEAGYKIMSAEPGRATQIQASFIDEGYKRAKKLREIIEDTKGITPEKQRELVERELGEWEKQVARKTDPSTARNLVKMLEEYATAAKLTSPLTHAINFGSTLMNYPIKAAENTVSTLIGTAQGRTDLGQLKYVFGTTQGAKSAVMKLGAEVKQALDPRAADLTPDGSKIENTPVIKGKAGKVIRTPFNMLQAADNFWKSILRDSEIHQRAYEKAYTEGFRGEKLATRISELVASPTDEMTKRAEAVAREWTFTTELGPMGQKISSFLGEVPGSRLLIPFIQTPTNIVKFQAQRHPIGVFSPRNIQSFRKGTNLERREAVARLTVGTGMAIAGYQIVQELGKNITGAAPSDKGERDLFYATRRKPFAIKVGDRWVSYNRFQPVGLYLTQAVAVRDKVAEIEKKNDKKGIPNDELGATFTAFANSTAQAIGELPFISGVSTLVEAISDPNEVNTNRLVGGVLTGLVPNVSRDVASAGDEYARQAKTPTEQIQMMIPGKRNDLPQRIDTFGQPQKQSGEAFERGFVKITSTEKNNSLADELRKVQYFPDAPKQTQRGKTLTQEQYEKFQTRSGELFADKLRKAVRDSEYQRLTVDRKQATLQRALTDARTTALDEQMGTLAKKKGEKVKRY